MRNANSLYDRRDATEVFCITSATNIQFVEGPNSFGKKQTFLN